MRAVEHFVTRFSDHFVLWLFVLMLIDTMGLPLPSELPLLYGGYLVSQHRLAFVPAGFVAAAGALVGSMLAYVVSRRYGRAAILRWGRRLFITEEHLHRSEAWFARRGEPAVFVCRMIPLAPTLISIPAGIAEMDPTRFAIYSFTGTLPWSFGLLGLGWALGENWRRVTGPFALVSLAVGAGLVVLGALWLLRRRRVARTNGS